MSDRGMEVTVTTFQCNICGYTWYKGMGTAFVCCDCDPLIRFQADESTALADARAEIERLKAERASGFWLSAETIESFERGLKERDELKAELEKRSKYESELRQACSIWQREREELARIGEKEVGALLNNCLDRLDQPTQEYRQRILEAFGTLVRERDEAETALVVDKIRQRREGDSEERA